MNNAAGDWARFPRSRECKVSAPLVMRRSVVWSNERSTSIISVVGSEHSAIFRNDHQLTGIVTGDAEVFIQRYNSRWAAALLLPHLRIRLAIPSSHHVSSIFRIEELTGEHYGTFRKQRSWIYNRGLWAKAGGDSAIAVTIAKAFLMNISSWCCGILAA
jgi:hypothetical protein